MAAAALLLSLVPLVWSTGAEAQARDPKRAEELFQEGKKQYEANDLGRACTTLFESDQLDPAIGTHGLLAACYEKQGKLAKALAAYRETQSRAEKAGDNRSAYAKERADALEAQVPRLRVTAQGNESGLQLTADGSAIGAGQAVALDPGEHVIVARAPGKKEFELRVALKAGERVDKTIPPLESDGTVAGPAPPLEPQPPVTVATTPDDGSTRRIAGVVLAGVGLAGIAVGSVFGIVAFSKASKASDTAAECPRGDAAPGCPDIHEEYDGIISDRNTVAMVSNVGFIAGAVFVVGGAVLYFTAPKAGAPTTGSRASAKHGKLHVLPTAGPRGAGAFVTGAF